VTYERLIFNPPHGWPKPPADWVPPKGWTPDPSWPAPPAGWQLWIRPGQPDGETIEAVAAPRAKSSSSTDATNLRDRIAELEVDNAALRSQLQSIAPNAEAVIELDDQRVLQDVGIYRYHHPLENSIAYRDRLDDLSMRVAEMVKLGSAIEKSNMFTFDGSLAKGRSMTNDLAKLMLRAYNAEAENAIRTLRAGSSIIAIKRLDTARTAIAKLGKMMEMHISDRYHALRVEEIELTSDFLVKKEEEREAQRAERERLREERKVEQELAAARERLNKERSHLLTVIEKLIATGATDAELERKLTEVDSAIEQNDFRAANIRAGYVYVISNRGAFGGHVVKIGLTRRLDPLERIAELGDASVPFKFDVHAIYFSEDAVTLENELHEHFAESRVNRVNNRREFFFAAPRDVRSILTDKLGNLLEFAETADSSEYLQSIQYWPEHLRPKAM
jgi:hypothetical protein